MKVKLAPAQSCPIDLTLELGVCFRIHFLAFMPAFLLPHFYFTFIPLVHHDIIP